MLSPGPRVVRAPPKGYLLEVEVDERYCTRCGRKLRKKYTPPRYPTGSLLGEPVLRHRRMECPDCGEVYGSPAPERLVPSHGNYAYDVIVEVGLARFRDHRQAAQIQRELSERYRRELPCTTILYLAGRFLDAFAAVHQAASERLRSWMLKRSGDYVVHLDGTCEDGSSVIFLLVEGQTGLIPLAGKMATESSADIEKLLRELVSRFGKPLATVRDLSRTIESARDERLPDVPDFVCEYHLLAVIGEKLLKTRHDKLKRIQQKLSIRAS